MTRLHIAAGALASLSLTIGLAAQSPTRSGTQGDRRLTIGFTANPEAVQALLPTPWRVDATAAGAMKGANFYITLIDRTRDDDPEGRARTPGPGRTVVLRVPAAHPSTRQAVGVIVGGFTSEASAGFYQVYRRATFQLEHRLRSSAAEVERITDIWHVRDADGHATLDFEMEAVPDVTARDRERGESNLLSAKTPALWRIYKFESASDVLKSVPLGIDRTTSLRVVLRAPELTKVLDGSEQLVGVSVTPWYVRDVFVK